MIECLHHFFVHRKYLILEMVEQFSFFGVLDSINIAKVNHYK